MFWPPEDHFFWGCIGHLACAICVSDDDDDDGDDAASGGFEKAVCVSKIICGDGGDGVECKTCVFLALRGERGATRELAGWLAIRENRVRVPVPHVQQQPTNFFFLLSPPFSQPRSLVLPLHFVRTTLALKLYRVFITFSSCLPLFFSLFQEKEKERGKMTIAPYTAIPIACLQPKSPDQSQNPTHGYQNNSSSRTTITYVYALAAPPPPRLTISCNVLRRARCPTVCGVSQKKEVGCG